eukprot:CAMPEP_0119086782 /NCGR_PEP_ID=MMETSP1178-20130426/139319_1 /TAXON_ID=33656 /ORGANISM="unid sp, Strain CCMP2000" /LENGTH=84 /DNA_ID=CAMNT_0007069937 /DNA_START=293 /DNA_END=547 /DNA_ORIENTATION=+
MTGRLCKSEQDWLLKGGLDFDLHCGSGLPAPILAGMAQRANLEDLWGLVAVLSAVCLKLLSRSATESHTPALRPMRTGFALSRR